MLPLAFQRLRTALIMRGATLLALTSVLPSCVREPTKDTARTTIPGSAPCKTSAGVSLFVPHALTKAGGFTREMEGPSVDPQGNIYAVAYGNPSAVAKVSPTGAAETFVVIPDGGAANGSVFNKQGDLFLADWIKHRVWRVPAGTRSLDLWVESDKMSQPNDLAVLRDGTLFLSDPDWTQPTNGKIWRSDGPGHLVKVADMLGTPNGIEVALDETFLITGESREKRIWRYDIRPDKSLGERTLWLDVSAYPGDVDGIRVDAFGNFYLAFYDGHRVLMVDPRGKILQDISTLDHEPSNLAFGGPDGCTLYLTDFKHGQLVEMRVATPGRHTTW